MTENKTIKLEPGDYILEYDTAKVAKAELMSMVEGLCDRGIRLWLVRSIGGDALRIVPKESAKSKEPIQYDDSTIQKDDKSIQYPKYLTAEGMRAYDGSKWV